MVSGAEPHIDKKNKEDLKKSKNKKRGKGASTRRKVEFKLQVYDKMEEAANLRAIYYRGAGLKEYVMSFVFLSAIHCLTSWRKSISVLFQTTLVFCLSILMR